MLDRQYIDTLALVYGRLAGSGVNWVLTGSLSFSIRGIPFDVHDIDIQTDRWGAYTIEKTFAAEITKKVTFVTSDMIRSHFGQLQINGLVVEIMGDIQKKRPDGSWEEPVDIDLHKQFVEVEHMLVPVLSLDYEYHAYQLLGREHVAALLRGWIDDKDA